MRIIKIKKNYQILLRKKTIFIWIVLNFSNILCAENVSKYADKNLSIPVINSRSGNSSINNNSSSSIDINYHLTKVNNDDSFLPHGNDEILKSKKSGRNARNIVLIRRSWLDSLSEGTPCLTQSGIFGRCTAFKTCYPYDRPSSGNNLNQWFLPRYEQCSYFNSGGKQFLGICCTEPEHPDNVGPPENNEGAIVDDNKVNEINSDKNDIEDIKYETMLSQWPPFGVPTHPTKRPGITSRKPVHFQWPPPIPTHPPNHAAPTHPPIYDRTTTTKAPWQTSTTLAPWQTSTKKTSWQTSTTRAPWQTSTTKSPWQTSTTWASWQTSTTKPPWQTSTTKAPWQTWPTTTKSPWQTSTTKAPWQTSTTKAPWQTSTTKAPWQTWPTTTKSPWQTSTTRPPWQTSTTKAPWQTSTTTKAPWQTTTRKWTSTTRYPIQWPPQIPTHPPSYPVQSTQPPSTDDQYDEDPIIPNAACGTKNGRSTDQERIVGGQTASPNEWPWIVVMFNNGRQFCGGSIIDNIHILTAAHCVSQMSAYDVARITVNLGDHDIRNPHEVQHVVRKVKRVVRHKGFDFSHLHNDVAVLTMDQPVEFTKTIRPICLPSASSVKSYRGMLATVAGWGSLRENGPQPSVLQKVTIPIWANADCSRKYGAAAPAGIANSMICAGQTSKDSCSGDSGGPMMVNEGGGRWVQVGIVSWGIGCGKGQYPGVYSRVSSFLPWIAKNLH